MVRCRSWGESARRGTFWACLATALGAAGCGGSFVPPPPPELSAVPSVTSGTAPVSTAPTIELILGADRTPDREAMEAAVRAETGRLRVMFVVERPAPGAPASAAAGLVRKAAFDRKVSALIVEGPADPAVDAAIKEARAGGVPVVTLGRRVDSGDPESPIPAAVFSPFGDAAKVVAEAVAKDAAAHGLPAHGHALIPRNEQAGPDAEPDVTALTAALKAAGFSEVQTVPFDGNYDKGKALLIERLKADPKVTAVVSHEDQGLSAAFSAQEALKASRMVDMAGFMALSHFMNDSVLSNCTVVIDRNAATLGLTAARLADALARGNPVAPVSTVTLRPNYRTASPGAVKAEAPPAPSEDPRKAP